MTPIHSASTSVTQDNDSGDIDQARAEARQDNLMNRWPGVIFSQRADFSFSFVSPRIESLTGVSPDGWIRGNHQFWPVVHEADAGALRRRLNEARDAREDVNCTFRVRNMRTGRVSYVWEQRRPVYGSDGVLAGYEGLWLDITRQTIAERRLLTMAWKENLGTLTMGLAHDFSNIMTGIVSLSQAFEQEFAQNKGLCDGLGLIRNSAMQAGELAHRIRQLHHGRPGQKNYHDLNEAVTNMTALLDKVLSRRVKVMSDLAASQLPVYVDLFELQQVIVNLALNAVDAMPDGGTLTLRTTRQEQDPGGRALQGAFPKAPMICLTVQDTGVGIPSEHLSSIFDPYFTTKPMGQGSGLGLYNARLFAENHGAAISVETSPQTGTAFHFWFGQSDFSETSEPGSAAIIDRPTVLVVGATEVYRRHLLELLRANEFYAVDAGSVQEACDTLHSADYELSAMVVLAQRANAEELSLLQRVRNERLPVKTFLSPVGMNQDEFNFNSVKTADGTLPHDLPPQEFIARLKQLLGKTRQGQNAIL